MGLSGLFSPEVGGREGLAAAQREDVAGVGRLLLVLACAGGPLSLEAAAAATSPELARLLAALLAPPEAAAITTWRQVHLGSCIHLRSPVACLNLHVAQHSGRCERM